uniref:Calcium-binding and coiled-coil domain-containing protein 2 n=1 Tax=Peromyscus maniculatus bairdii TaxID=230844 RepID=A0A8C8UIG8_PERMB
MDKTMDEPPISAVLLEHCSFSQVVFNSVEKFYVPGGDVTCYYTFTQQFIPRRKDWIGIFKVSEVLHVAQLVCAGQMIAYRSGSLLPPSRSQGGAQVARRGNMFFLLM